MKECEERFSISGHCIAYLLFKRTMPGLCLFITALPYGTGMLETGANITLIIRKEGGPERKSVG